jgi:hypothetical protein
MATMQPADLESNAKSPEKTGMSTPMKVLVGLAIFSACATGGIIGVVSGLTGDGNDAVKGTWVSNWGTYLTITDTTWYSVSSWGSSASTIERITPNYIITQNPADDAYNPSLWSKHEYHELEGGGWGYCTSVFDAATADDAVSFDTSEIYDENDADAGCNTFGHTTVSAYAMPIAGSWMTNWGSALEISSSSWSSVSSWGSSLYAVEAYGASFVLMQNPADDSYNPSKWSKIEFTMDGSDFSYCTTVFDGASAAAALTTDTSAFYDATNATAGCNSFGHTIASPA